jgi:hypothetical protein
LSASSVSPGASAMHLFRATTAGQSYKITQIPRPVQGFWDDRQGLCNCPHGTILGARRAPENPSLSGFDDGKHFGWGTRSLTVNSVRDFSSSNVHTQLSES